MILNIIYGILLIGFVLLVKFIFQPFSNWKKQRQNSKGTKDLIIYYKGKDYPYEEFKKSINEKVFLSLVVPSYNEEERLPVMLKQTIDFFQKKNYSYEIIVVSDASKDKTVEVAKQFINYEGKTINLKVVHYVINKGKGGAVRSGMFVSQGDHILMVDADGATKIDDFDKVWDNYQKISKNGMGIMAGSRHHLNENVEIKRKPIRKILQFISNFIVQQICGVKLKDTQCGFKIFSRNTSRILFQTLHLERWAFDVELFMIANHHKIPYDAIPVNWHDVDGSKLNVVEASITMTRDFLLVRLLYLLRIWKFDDSIQG